MIKLIVSILMVLMVVPGIASAKSVKIRGVVVQANVSKAQLEHSLKLSSNMHSVLKSTKFEVVVFGPIVKLLTVLGPEEPLIERVESEGIKVIACNRSLRTDNVKKSDLAPGVKVVPFGAVYIIQREKEGWQYFKP